MMLRVVLGVMLDLVGSLPMMLRLIVVDPYFDVAIRQPGGPIREFERQAFAQFRRVVCKTSGIRVARLPTSVSTVTRKNADRKKKVQDD
jgi:hypothetical protein